MVRFCAIVGPRSVLWSSPLLSYRAKDDLQDAWLTRNSGPSYQTVAYRLPTGWTKWPQREVLGALVGFEGIGNDKAYFRCEITNEDVNEHHELQASIGTCNEKQIDP